MCARRLNRWAGRRPRRNCDSTHADLASLRNACSRRNLLIRSLEAAVRSLQPIRTVGNPAVMAPPWRVTSRARAAGCPPMNTQVEPIAMTSGGPMHMQRSPTRAAGCPPISTFTQPGGAIGPPTCGTGGTTGVARGQACRSPTRAAGFPIAATVASVTTLAAEAAPRAPWYAPLSSRLPTGMHDNVRQWSRRSCR